MEELEYKLNELDPDKEYFLFIDRKIAPDVARIKLKNPTKVWIIATLDGELLDREAAKKLIDADHVQ